MLRELYNCKHTDDSKYLNYLLIPVTVFNIDEKGASKFNKIFNWCKNQELGQLRGHLLALFQTKEEVLLGMLNNQEMLLK